ncbi:hypothetical protein [Pseudomonas serbica]|jgi:hypothetical protein|uniref:hypothetical protein n=1 Tax=Pseudomonas serbica TaxID=2965074 RepID=UPI00237A29E0|nr:hypothetical protein [Pseudomonas serbica]
MMTPAAALGLALKDQVKFGKETLTVIGTVDVGTHQEPLLISETGKKFFGTLYIAHLLSILGEPVPMVEEDDGFYIPADDAPLTITAEPAANKVTEAVEAMDAPATSPESALPESMPLDDEPDIPADELELVKAYALNELI